MLQISISAIGCQALAYTYECMYIIHMPQITEIQARTILTPQKFGSLAGFYDYSLNPYAGCAFKCSYCYVPSFPSAKHQPGEWGNWIEVKKNAPELIRKERTRVFGSRIFFSSATDPYQYIELQYRLSRACLSELLRYQPAHLTMHTRSHLILQDIDLLKAFGDRLTVGISITTDNDEIRKQFEPQAPSIGRRLELLRGLHAAGIKVYASLAPLLPGNADKLIEQISPYVDKIWLDEMRYLEVNNRPDLLEEHRDFFARENYRRTIEYIRGQFKNAA